jgi:hypothetical protein
MQIQFELDEREYRELELEAQRRGLEVAELAQSLVQRGLQDDRGSERVRKGIEALTLLREFRRSLPAAEIGPIIKASRADLEERPRL